MVITISKQEIFNEVEKRTSIEGVMIPERFDQIWATSYDGEIMDSYWIEGYTAVIQILKRYISNSSISFNLESFESDEVLAIQAAMPARYNTLYDGSVATDVKMIIACNIVASWLDIKAPETSAKYKEEIDGYVQDLQLKLLYRVEPTNNAVDADDDSTNIFDSEAAIYKADADSISISAVETSISAHENDKETLNKVEESPAAADTDSEAVRKTEKSIEVKGNDSEQIQSLTDEVIGSAKNDTEKVEQIHCGCRIIQDSENCCNGYCNW